MSRSKNLAQRREELVARSNLQRVELLAQAQATRESMAVANIGASLLASAKQNKLLFAGAALAALVVTVLKPRRIVAGLEAGLIGWQLWRNATPLLQCFRKRPGSSGGQ